jgi:hypothetical protein
MATRWNATDYAKNSQGQFAWALAIADRLSIAGGAGCATDGAGAILLPMVNLEVEA